MTIFVNDNDPQRYECKKKSNVMRLQQKTMFNKDSKAEKMPEYIQLNQDYRRCRFFNLDRRKFKPSTSRVRGAMPQDTVGSELFEKSVLISMIFELLQGPTICFNLIECLIFFSVHHVALHTIKYSSTYIYKKVLQSCLHVRVFV